MLDHRRSLHDDRQPVHRHLLSRQPHCGNVHTVWVCACGPGPHAEPVSVLQYNGSLVFGVIEVASGGGRRLTGSAAAYRMRFVRALADPQFPVSETGSTALSWAIGNGLSISSGVATSQVRHPRPVVVV